MHSIIRGVLPALETSNDGLFLDNSQRGRQTSAKHVSDDFQHLRISFFQTSAESSKVYRILYTLYGRPGPLKIHFLDRAGLIIGPYRVVFHGEYAREVQKCVAPQNYRKNLTNLKQI